MNRVKPIDPCPCGSDALATSTFDCGLRMEVFRVICIKCLNATDWQYDRKEAIWVWNEKKGVKS